MRLLINYKGINKLMISAENFEGIKKFILENFFLKMSKWHMSYIDSDGDEIALDSQQDYETMRETLTKDHLKVYVKDKESSEEDISEKRQRSAEIKTLPPSAIQKSTNAIPQAQLSDPEQLRRQRVEQPNQALQKSIYSDPNMNLKKELSEKKQKIPEPKIGDPKKDAIQSKGQEQLLSGELSNNELMNRLIDERVKSLIPMIAEQVEQTMKMSTSKINNKQDHSLPQGQYDSKTELRPKNQNRLQIVNHCYKMSEFFGGAAADYEKFVIENHMLCIEQMCKLYSRTTGAHIDDGWLIKEKVVKLALYFKQDASHFQSLIKAKPFCKLDKLVKIVESDPNFFKPGVAQSKVQQPTQVKKAPVIESKPERKVQEKTEQKKPQSSQPQVQEIKREQNSERATNHKRNNCILTFKQLFGEEGVFEYIEFVNMNIHLSESQIVDKYIKIKDQKQ